MEPVHTDLGPSQLGFNTVPQLGELLLTSGDQFNINCCVEERLPVALGRTDHRGNIFQIALGLYNIPNICAAGFETIGLVRCLEDFPFLRRRNQTGVDPQGNACPFSQPLEDCLFFCGGGVSPDSPYTPPGISQQIPIHLEADCGRRDEIQEGLQDLFLIHHGCGFVIAPAILHEPSLPVKIIIAFTDHIPGKVDCQNPLDILAVSPAYRKSLFPDHLFQPGQVRVDLPLSDVPGTDDQHKLPGGGCTALDLIQVPQILFQKCADLRDRFLLDPPGQVLFVVLKTLSGIEAEQFHLRKALENIHQRIHSGPKPFSGQHRNIGGLQQEEDHFLALRSNHASLGDGLNVHQSAGAFISPRLSSFFC